MIARRSVGFPPLAVAALGALLLAAASAGAQVRAAKPAAPAQPGASSPAPRKADAYYQFMLGRRLESDGDIDGAIAAYQQAARLDPGSAEILAELAGLYARESKVQEAIGRAEAALAIDPANGSAHRVLGILDASLARLDQGTGPLDGESAKHAAEAAGHLEAARKASELPDSGLDMMLARIYVRTGERDLAIAALGRVALDNPGQPEPVRQLLQLYQQAGRDREAVALLESVVEEQPSFYAPLAQLYEKQQRFGDAARAYERAMSADPGGPDFRTELAIAWLSSGDPARTTQAVGLLEQVRQQNPADTRVLYLLSQAERASGRLDRAEATARDLMTIAPGSLTGPYALALVFEQKQQYRQVVETLGPIVDRQAAGGSRFGTEYGPVLIRLGVACLELGDAERALTEFERARAIDATTPAIDLYMLQAQLSARRYEAAAASASKLRASRPDDPRVLRLSAEALRRIGQVDEGEAMLTASLDRHPADLVAYLSVVEYDMQAGRYDAALAVLDRAAKQFPSNLDVVFQTGAVLERAKRFAEAEQRFRDVIARDPRHAMALNYLGYMLADRGERLDESIGYIKRALDVDPYNNAYLDSLGWAYFRQNKLDLAEGSLKRAAEQRVRDSAVQDHYGDLLFRLGRYQEAATAWQRALDGDMEQVDRAAIEKKLRSAKDKTRKP